MDISFLVALNAALMKVKDVGGNSHIVLFGVDVPNHKDTVEPGQYRCLKLNLFCDLLTIVISTENRIGCS